MSLDEREAISDVRLLAKSGIVLAGALTVALSARYLWLRYFVFG